MFNKRSVRHIAVGLTGGRRVNRWLIVANETDFPGAPSTFSSISLDFFMPGSSSLLIYWKDSN